jgi:hypothetical protein
MRSVTLAEFYQLKIDEYKNISQYQVMIYEELLKDLLERQEGTQ